MGDEVKVKLSADASDFKSVMSDAANYAGKVGEKIAHKFEFRDVARTLTTALGVSLENISENIARFFTGVTKETEKAFADIIKLGEDTAATYEALYRSRRSAEQNVTFDISEQNKLLREQHAIQDDIAKRRYGKNRYGGTIDHGDVATAEQKTRLEEISNKLAKDNVDIHAEQGKVDAENAKRQKEDIDDVITGLAMERAENAKKNDEDLKWVKEGDALQAKITQRAFEQLAPEQQLIELQKKRDELQRAINDKTTDRNVMLKDTLQLQDTDAQILKIQNDLMAQQAKSASAIDDTIGSWVGKLKSFVAEWTGFQSTVNTVGKGDKDLTDAELRRKVASIQKDIFARNTANATAAGGAYYNPSDAGNDGLLEAQKAQLQQAMNELNLRNGVRRAANAFGKDAAFDQYSGLSEQRLNAILNGQDVSTLGQIATQLASLNKTLIKGVSTIDLGTGGG